MVINMDLNNIPSEFQNKLRLSIIASLTTGEKTFKELLNITKSTDGNLSSQLKHLQKSNYISCTKEFYNNKPRSKYKITEYGKNMFIEYVLLLERFV